jgi:hypothetical protein
MKVTYSHLMNYLKLDSVAAAAIVSLIKGKESPESYGVKTVWDDQFTNDEILQAIDCILGTCGVESVSIPGDYDSELYYCNTGDSYGTTVCYESATGEWFIWSWADWYEYNSVLDLEYEETETHDKYGNEL